MSKKRKEPSTPASGIVVAARSHDTMQLDTQAVENNILEKIQIGLSVENTDEQISNLALLSSLSSTIVFENGQERMLMQQVLRLLKSQEVGVACEATQCIRSWLEAGEDELIRRIYAYQIFPILLDQCQRVSSFLSQVPGSITDPAAIDLLVSGWCSSLLSSINAIVGNIPASINQLNKASANLLDVVSSLLEKRSFFPANEGSSSVLILALQTIATVMEDNEPIASPSAASIRLVDQLVKLLKHEDAHHVLLARWLLLQFSEENEASLQEFINEVSILTIQQESCAVDFLEFISNCFSFARGRGTSLIVGNELLQVVINFFCNDEELITELAAACLGEIVIPASCSLSTEQLLSLRDRLFTVLASACIKEQIALLVHEIVVVLALRDEKIPLRADQHLLLRGTSMKNLICPSLAIIALTIPNDSDIAWLNQMITQVIINAEFLSIKQLVCLAEAIEELCQRSSIQESTKEALTNHSQRLLQRSLHQSSLQGEEDCSEEFEYVSSCISRAIQ